MNCIYVLYPDTVIVTGFVTQMIYMIGASHEGRQIIIFFINLLSPPF